MQDFINFLLGIYVPITIVASLLLALFAERIFLSEQQRKGMSRVQRVYQFWLNFVGSMAGWFSLYIFLTILQRIEVKEISFVHITLLIVGVIGIVGLLPT